MSRLGYVFLPGDLTQASSNLPAPSGAGSGSSGTVASVIATNQYSPTDWYVLFFGANQTVTNGLLWGWSTADNKWWQIYTFDTPFTIVSASLGVGRRVTGIGCWDNFAVSGTASVGNVTVIFRPTGLTG